MDIMMKDLRRMGFYIKWFWQRSKGFRLGIVLIILLESLGSLAGVGTAVASKNLIDYAVAADFAGLVPWAWAFVGIIVLNLGVEAWSNLLGVSVNQRINNHLREQAFVGISRSEWLEVSRYHSGDLLTRLTEDVECIADSYTGLVPHLISLSVGFGAAFIVLFRFDPFLAVLAFALAPVALVLSRCFMNKGKQLYHGVQESESSTRAYVQESLQNLLVMKTFQMEAHSHSRLQRIHNERLHWLMARNRYGVLAGTVMSSAYWLGYLAAFGWGAYRLMTKSITFGTVAAFLQLVEQIQNPLIAIAYSIPQMIAAVGSSERLMELEELTAEVQYGEMPPLAAAGFTLEDVDFSYEDNMPVLNRASITVKAGEMVALMGPSGEGKTTVIRLLMALIKPAAGQVTFEGENGRPYPANAGTRSLIAYVPQGNTLFSGTIGENLRASRATISEEELMAACKAADLKGFIDSLPEGLQTIVGEDGLGVSEGQAQRIAIARALLRDAPVLILDEATSALDMDTEARILKSIEGLPKRKTCLLITHRPSILGICSRTVRLKNGKLLIDEESVFNT